MALLGELFGAALLCLRALLFFGVGVALTLGTAWNSYESKAVAPLANWATVFLMLLSAGMIWYGIRNMRDLGRAVRWRLRASSEEALQLTNAGFSISKASYAYEDVARIAVWISVVKKSLNLVPAGTDHTIVVRLDVHGQSEPAVFVSGPTILRSKMGSDGEAQSKKLLEKTALISERSRIVPEPLDIENVWSS